LWRVAIAIPSLGWACAGLVLATAATPFAARADSRLTAGTGSTVTASAHLMFKIVIPNSLSLRVGSASIGTAAGAVTTQGVGNDGPVSVGSTTAGGTTTYQTFNPNVGPSITDFAARWPLTDAAEDPSDGGVVYSAAMP
jgi:hypothetical protein